MKILSCSSAFALLLGIALGLPTAASAQTSVTLEITDHTNAVWDVTHLPLMQHISMGMERMSGAGTEINYDAPFAQFGGGRLQGSGSTEMSVHYRSQGQWIALPAVQGNYRVNGSITGVRGNALVTFASTASGPTVMNGMNRTVTGQAHFNLRINATTGMMSGRSSNLAMGMGMGAMTDHSMIESQAIPTELGNGSWTLRMDFDPPVGNKLSGQGSVTLNSGMVMPFKVTGTYGPNTHTSLLTLKGTDAGRNSTLQVKLVDGAVKKVTGRISGQMVRVIK